MSELKYLFWLTRLAAINLKLRLLLLIGKEPGDNYKYRLFVKITNTCNYQCSICGNWKNKNKNKKNKRCKKKSKKFKSLHVESLVRKLNADKKFKSQLASGFPNFKFLIRHSYRESCYVHQLCLVKMGYDKVYGLKGPNSSYTVQYKNNIKKKTSTKKVKS